jgi:hypothetical protein
MELFKNEIYNTICESNYFAYLGEKGGIIADNTNNFEKGYSPYLLNYESINPVDLENRFDVITKTENKTPHFDSNTFSMRNFIFEIDVYSLKEQKLYVKELKKKNIINRAVFSGNKSIHFRITIDREPENKDIYKLIWNYFDKIYFDNKTDKQCSNPTRFTRRPNFTNSKKDKKQLLIYSGNTILPVSAFSDIILQEYKVNQEQEERDRILRIMNADNPNNKSNWKTYVKKAVENSDSTDEHRHELFSHISGCVYGKNNMNPDFDDFVDYFNECLEEPLGKDAIKALKHRSGYKLKLPKHTETEKAIMPNNNALITIDKNTLEKLKENITSYSVAKPVNAVKPNSIAIANVAKPVFTEIIKQNKQEIPIQSIQEQKSVIKTELPKQEKIKMVNNKVIPFYHLNTHTENESKYIAETLKRLGFLNKELLSCNNNKSKTTDNEPNYVECFMEGGDYLEELEKTIEKHDEDYYNKLDRELEELKKKYDSVGKVFINKPLSYWDYLKSENEKKEVI